MKRWLSILLSGWMIFILASCGGTVSTSPAPSHSGSSSGLGSLNETEPVSSQTPAPLQDSQLIPAIQNGSYGFVDENDQTLIPFSYDEVGTYADGLCRVYDASRGKWGFINRSNELVIDYTYLSAQDFDHGLAAVKTSENGQTGWGYINTQGTMVIDPIYSQCGSYGDGLLPVQYNGYWGFIGTDGSTVIDFLYSDIDPNGFQYGRAVVAINDAWGVIDSSGESILPLDKDAGTLRYNCESFFQLGTNVYNKDGQLLREKVEIWHADDDLGRCLVFDGEGAAEIIDTNGNTVTDLCQLAAQTLPKTEGEISIALFSSRNRTLKQDMTGWDKNGTYQLQWDGWMLIQAKDAGRALFEGDRSLYLNLVNLEGELFWEDWLVQNDHRASYDLCEIELYRHYAIVSHWSDDDGYIEVWNLNNGSHNQLAGNELNNGFRWDISNMTLWGDFLIAQPKTQENGSSLTGIYSLDSLRNPYLVSGYTVINDQYLCIRDTNEIFYGILSNQNGTLSETFPLDYTKIEYINHGEENGNFTFQRGADETRYWLGPNGHFIAQ